MTECERASERPKPKAKVNSSGEFIRYRFSLGVCTPCSLCLGNFGAVDFVCRYVSVRACVYCVGFSSSFLFFCGSCCYVHNLSMHFSLISFCRFWKFYSLVAVIVARLQFSTFHLQQNIITHSHCMHHIFFFFFKILKSIYAWFTITDFEPTVEKKKLRF